MNPWEEAPHIWATKAAFFSYLRGALRQAIWNRWPLKIEFKNSVCNPPPDDYKGRAKTGTYCALSGEWIGKSAAEIDHIFGNVSLQDWEDLLPFIQHMCASKDNMQYVSKEAHKVKSYAERKGVSFEEAMVEKTAIAICKSKKDKEWLEDRGIRPDRNALKRRGQIIKALNGGL